MYKRQRSAYVNKLQGELRIAFPQYLGIFSKVTINTSLTLLETYTSPSAFLKADKHQDDILAGRKTITIRDESESHFKTGDVLRVGRFEDGGYFCTIEDVYKRQLNAL